MGNIALSQMDIKLQDDVPVQITYDFVPKTLVCRIRSSYQKSLQQVALQKQPSKSVLRKRYSENMQQIYRTTSMLKCDLNNIAKQSNFIEIALRHECSLVNLLHIFRTPFPKEHLWVAASGIINFSFLYSVLAIVNL